MQTEKRLKSPVSNFTKICFIILKHNFGYRIYKPDVFAWLFHAECHFMDI